MIESLHHHHFDCCLRSASDLRHSTQAAFSQGFARDRVIDLAIARIAGCCVLRRPFGFEAEGIAGRLRSLRRARGAPADLDRCIWPYVRNCLGVVSSSARPQRVAVASNGACSVLARPFVDDSLGAGGRACVVSNCLLVISSCGRGRKPRPHRLPTPVSLAVTVSVQLVAVSGFQPGSCRRSPAKMTRLRLASAWAIALLSMRGIFVSTASSPIGPVSCGRGDSGAGLYAILSRPFASAPPQSHDPPPLRNAHPIFPAGRTRRTSRTPRSRAGGRRG